MALSQQRSQISWVLSPPLFASLLLTVQLVPPLPQYLGFAPSMALGATSAAVVALFVCLLNDAMSKRLLSPASNLVDTGVISAAALATGLVLLHGIVADWLERIDLMRFALSLALLALVLCGAIALGRALSRCPDRTVDNAVRLSFWVLCTVIALQVIGVQPRLSEYPKSMFPFTETSHFALAFAPVLLYRCVYAKRYAAIWWLATGFAIAVFVQSLTLLVGCLAAAIACRRFLFVAVPTMVLLLVGLPLELEYFTNRLAFSDNQANLSTLVYFQGWQLLQECLARSFGWGVGFQQLGLQGFDAAAADLIRGITGQDLNLLDGGFVLAKLGSEFGIFGLLLCACYVLVAVRCMQGLRAGGANSATTFARCIVVAYGVDMFVRGTGYFTESTLLFLVAVSALLTASGLPGILFAPRARVTPLSVR